MANQIIIDIGAVANDGTGDPLRTAFNYVNNNFSNVWATGVANSNIQFSGNRILTSNTNGNLILAPNGTGKVQANVDIVPNANNTLSLGSSTRKWNTIYTQDLSVGGNTTFNNLLVDGNLTVTGNIIQIGNIVTDSKTIQLSNTASTTTAANGSGITVGALDNIATLLYNSSSNVWTTNIGLTATGNISGTYFIGNGALLTGVASSYGNANVASYLPTYTGNISANNALVTSAISSNDAYIKRGTFSGDPISGSASMYVGSPTFTNLGTDVMAQFTGNVTNYAQINMQNYGNSPTSSGDYIITADNGTDSTHFLDLGLTSSTWDGSQPNSLGNRLGPNDGYLYVQDGDFVLGTTDGTINTWKFDQDGNLTVPGAIVPAGNNTQSLGNATNQWNDLYVSNATIYMNNVPVSLTAGNVLTVNGQAVLSNDSNTSIDTTGNITATNVTTSEWVYANLGVETQQIQFVDPFGISANSVNLLVSDGDLVYESTVGSSGGFRPSSNNSESLGKDDYRWDTIYGNVINATIFTSTNTVIVDNRETGNTADIQLYSADDILLQARDRTIGDDIEGGDINIYAGDGSPDDAGGGTGTGGDIQIIGGVGGAADVSSAGGGGFVRLDAGNGGDGSATAAAGSGATAYLSAGDGGVDNGGGGNNGGDVVITAGDTTDVAQDRGSIILNAGAGGDETTLRGFVQVHIPSVGANPGGDWTFTGSGTTLEVPQNAEIFGPNFGNLTVGAAGNTIITSADYGITTYNWVFDNAGNLNLPNNGSINFNAGGITQATDEDFVITVNDADDDGFAIFNRITDTDGNVVGQTELRRDRLNINLDMLGSNYQWQFSDTQGIMYLPGNISGNYGSDTSFFVTDNGSGGTMEMKTISYIGDTLGSNVRVTQSNATISTSNAAYTWTFDNTGNLTVPGNTIVSTANATGGLGGKSISITAGASDTVTWNSNPGGNVNITGGYGSFGDGGGGPGGQVNIIGGGSSDSHAGNVTINSGTSTWTFDYTGSFVFPGGGVTMDGQNNALLTSGLANVTIGTFVQGADGGVSWEYQGDGADANTSYGAVGLDTAGTANTANLQFKVQLVADQGDPSTNKEWIFNTAGNLTTPGSIITGSGSGGNISGANVISANVFVASGNITGANLIASANVSVTGRVAVGNGSASVPSFSFTSDGAVDTGFYWVSDGNIGVTNNGVQTAQFLPDGVFKQIPRTVGTLPAAATVGAGARAFCTDLNSTVFGNLAVGGGGTYMPVFSNGTNWYIG